MKNDNIGIKNEFCHGLLAKAVTKPKNNDFLSFQAKLSVRLTEKSAFQGYIVTKL